MPPTPTSVAAGRIPPKIAPCTAVTSPAVAMSVTKMRVRTTSVRAKPASVRARSMIPSAARAWAAGSPGWSDRPSGPASVVPATQHESPTTMARL